MSEREFKRQAAVDLELIRRNRQVLSERLRWPAGTLQACEELDRRLPPGWTVSWLPENTVRGFESPASFIAWRLKDGIEVRAPDPEALLAAAEDEPEHEFLSFDCRCRRCR